MLTAMMFAAVAVLVWAVSGPVMTRWRKVSGPRRRMGSRFDD